MIHAGRESPVLFIGSSNRTGRRKPMGVLGEQIAGYGSWRRELSESVQRYGRWLTDAELSDAALQARVDRIAERLAKDRISIAFVAEFSRGK
ncbi:MAG TPA: hypothetical protein PKB08_07685, partial [Burkholderiaceae bacterium]|nr:hypothetical protein [Burkholderiaceae bacterium]